MRLSAYRRGFEVVGVSFDDFVPWLNATGKAAGALSGGFASGVTGGAIDLAKGDKKSSTEQQIKRALEEERRRREVESARTTRLLLYGTLGVLGVGIVGTTIWAIARK